MSVEQPRDPETGRFLQDPTYVARRAEEQQREMTRGMSQLLRERRSGTFTADTGGSSETRPINDLIRSRRSVHVRSVGRGDPIGDALRARPAARMAAEPDDDAAA